VSRVSILWQAVGIATLPEQQRLGLLPGDRVLRSARVRFGDSLPVAYELVSVAIEWLPATNGSADALDIVSLAALSGITLGNAVEMLTVVAADATTAQQLGIVLGAPVLHVDRIVHAADGTPLEWQMAYIRR
jgi:GntR family transcriptional regulator